MIFSKLSIRTYQTFLKPGSTFLPTYSWLRINKNLVLHSKSNFAENSSCFHIQSQIEYNLSPKWSLNIYGVQNLDTRKHRGLPSEVEPTQLGSNVVLKINKNWKIKSRGTIPNTMSSAKDGNGYLKLVFHTNGNPCRQSGIEKF